MVIAPYNVRKIVRKAGISRVSKRSVILLGKILESVGEQICREALMPMMISKRTTLLPTDVEIGAKKVINYPREMNLRRG